MQVPLPAGSPPTATWYSTRKLGEQRAEELVARANVTDQAALQVFRDRASKDGGVLPMLTAI